MTNIQVGTVTAKLRIDDEEFKTDISNIKASIEELDKAFFGVGNSSKNLSSLTQEMNRIKGSINNLRKDVDALKSGFQKTNETLKNFKKAFGSDLASSGKNVGKLKKDFDNLDSSAKKVNSSILEVGSSGKRAFSAVSEAIRYTKTPLNGLEGDARLAQKEINSINNTSFRGLCSEIKKTDEMVAKLRVSAENTLRVLNSPVSIGSGYNSYLKSLKGIFPDKKITSTGYGDALNNNSIIQQYKNYIAGVDEAQRLYFQKLQMGAVERSRAERAYFKGDGVKYFGYQGTTKSSAYNQYYEKLISSEQTSRSKYVTKLLEGHRRVQQAEKEYMAKSTTPASFAGNSFANQVKQYLDKEAKQIESAQNIYQSKLNRLAEQSQRLHREVAEKMANAEAMLMGGWKVPTYTEKLKGKTGSFTNGGYAQYLTAMNEATKASKIMQETNFKNMQSDLLKSLDYSKLASSTSKVKTEMNATANSIRNVASASSTATGKTKELQSAFGSLSNTSGRLKSMVTMVSSLFAWQFANDLLTSIGETIKAKTEMTSLFQAMDLGSGSIKRFNEALDATVDKYQKLNKFSMGETVASLGVEFDLSTEQMTKAMPVLAMIQSEYIRAGRTSEEATLAVKDIMQGEFLRLSRETGVGQSELKNAGWNGAVQTAEDMDTLLDALQKVGESRHWDVFASKATSLNDVLLITQNRFSEFVAELVDLVAPAIVGFFNGIVGVFDGIGNWFHGLSGFMKGFLALPTLIATLGVATVSLINFRTGMSLLEIASNGLGNSLLATVFKLDKLKVAQWGSITTLGAMITKYKEATVASAGFVQSIVGRIIGVNELHLAENGLGNAIALTSKSLSMEAQQMLTSNTVTLKWHQGLAMLTGNISLSEAKTKSFAGSMKVLLTTMAGAKVIAFTSIILALAVAFGTVYSACQKAKDAVDRFNYVAENGEDIIKKAENVNNAYSSRVSELKTELDGLTEGTSEYARKQSELNSVQKDAERATNNLADAKQAYANAQAIQTQLDQRQTSILGQNAEALRETYESLGIEDAYVKSSKYLNDVERGGQVLVHAMEQYGERIRSGSAHWKEHAGQMEEAGVSAEAISQYVDDYNTELLATAENWKKFNEGDMWAGLYAILGELKLMWIDFTSNPEVVAFFETLKEIWKDCEPPLRAICEFLKNFAWEGFKAFANMVTTLKGFVGTGGTLALLAVGLYGVGRAVKYIGDVMKSSDVVEKLPDILTGGSKNKDSDNKKEDGDTKGKNKNKKGKGKTGGSTGGIFDAPEDLVKTLKNDAKVAVRLMVDLALAMALITEAILLLSLPMTALAGLGALADILGDNVDKGVEAIKKVNEALMNLLPELVGFLLVGKLYKMSGSSLKEFSLDSFATVAVTIALVAEAIALLSAPLASLALLGAVSGLLGDYVDKGIGAIKQVNEAMTNLLPELLTFVMFLSVYDTFGNNGQVQFAKSLAKGIALSILLVTEAIVMLVAPLAGLAILGAIRDALGDSVNTGIEAIKTVVSALEALTPMIPLFIAGIVLASIIATGVGSIALPVVVAGIGLSLLLVAESIMMLEAPLFAISNLATLNPNIEQVKKGAEIIKEVGIALSYLDEATSAIAGISWDGLITWLSSGGQDMKSVVQGLSAEDGILTEMAKFPAKFNEITADIQPIDSTKADALKTSADVLKTLDDTIGYVKEIIESSNYLKNGTVSTNGTAQTGTMRNASGDSTLSLALDKIESNIDDIISFNKALKDKEITPPPEGISEAISQSGSVINNLKTATDNVKNAVSASTEVGQTAVAGTGLFGMVGAFFMGSNQGGSGLQAGLNQLLADVDAIIKFNNDLNAKFGGENATAVNQTASSAVAGVTGMIQTLSSEIAKMKEYLNTSGDSLNADASSMGTKIKDGFKAGLSGLSGALNEPLNTAFNTANQTVISRSRELGTNAVNGFKFTASGLKDVASQEVDYALGKLNRGDDFYNKGYDLGKKFVDGYKDGMDSHSPGLVARTTEQEIGYTVGFLQQGTVVVGQYANGLANSIVSQFVPALQTMEQVRTGLSDIQLMDSQFGGMDTAQSGVALSQYRSDANTALAISQDTVNGAMLAFNGMDTNLGITFMNMQNTVGNTFTNMNQTATSNYTKIANTSKTQLSNMQSQTTKNIGAIRTSWQGMQTALIASAENIRSQTSSKIGQLENNMARFWRKVQNPALLIAGAGSGERQGTNTRSIGVRRSVASNIGRLKAPVMGMGYGKTGISTSKYPVRKSKGSPDDLNLMDYLSCNSSNGQCFAGWNFNWSPDIQKALLTWRTHFGDIYDGKLRVGKFENDDFPVRRDTDIFKRYVVDAISRTTYEPYFNSKYGTALNAWNAGHFNCYDGMLVVMALASAFGLGSSMRSGYWGSIPHVWAYVEGVGDVDATAIQGGYGLTSPKVSGKASIQKWRRDASGETTTNNNNNKEINLTLNFDLTNSYVEKGVEEKIGDIAVRKVADLLGVNPATGL